MNKIEIKHNSNDGWIDFTGCLLNTDDFIIEHSSPRGSGFGYTSTTNVNSIKLGGSFYDYIFSKFETDPVTGNKIMCLENPMMVRIVGGDCCTESILLSTYGPFLNICCEEKTIQFDIADCSSERECYVNFSNMSVATAALSNPSRVKFIRYARGQDFTTALWSFLYINFTTIAGPFASILQMLFSGISDRIAGVDERSQLFYLRDILEGGAARCGLTFCSDLFQNPDSIMHNVALWCPKTRGNRVCQLNYRNFPDMSFAELLIDLESLNIGWKIQDGCLYVEREDKIRCMGPVLANIDELDYVNSGPCYDFDPDSVSRNVVIRWKDDGTNPKGNEQLTAQYNSTWFGQNDKFSQPKIIDVPFASTSFVGDTSNDVVLTALDPRSLRTNGTPVIESGTTNCCKLLWIDRCVTGVDGCTEAFVSCATIRPLVPSTLQPFQTLGFGFSCNYQLYTTPQEFATGDRVPTLFEELTYINYGEYAKKIKVDSLEFNATCEQFQLFKRHGSCLVLESKYGKGFFLDAVCNHTKGTITLNNVCFYPYRTGYWSIPV